MADQPQTPDQPDDPYAGLPPEIAEVLSRLTGGLPLDPETANTLKGMGIDQVDPAMLSMVASQVQAMLSTPADGPMNATLALDVARKTVAAGGDASVGQAAGRELAQAAQVASLWLDEATAFESPGISTSAWSRAEWVEATLPMWRTVVEPVAEGVTRAIAEAMRKQVGELGELGESPFPPGMLPAGMDAGALLGQMQPMVERMSSAMFGAQVGQAVGTLAGDVLTGTEMGLPLVDAGAVVLLPANVAAFAEGLGIDVDQVRLFLAVREAARIRLFAGAPWLGPQLVAAVRDYARDITIDTDRIEANLAGIDPTDASALQGALQGQLFHPEPSAAQQAALRRLETYLALVEGWVDVVTARATAGHLPQAAALGEAVRRRRATGGPEEKAFAGLVGLELRPRRLRDAANLFAALESSGGPTGRDAAWGHPDVAPSAADLDDPLGYVERVRAGGAPDEVDAALDALLRGDHGPAPTDEPGGR